MHISGYCGKYFINKFRGIDGFKSNFFNEDLLAFANKSLNSVSEMKVAILTSYQ